MNNNYNHSKMDVTVSPDETEPLTDEMGHPITPKPRSMSESHVKVKERNQSDPLQLSEGKKHHVEFGGSLQDLQQFTRARKISRRIMRQRTLTAERMRRLSQRTFSAVEPTDENPERGTWSNQFEFFLSCLGYAVGLGNVWRFPYQCYSNGGGAFLIAFTLMLAFCALPLLFLELSMGQFSSEGPITVWKLSPLFKGIGMAMVWVSVVLACYYNVVTGWAFYYLYASLTSRLPWMCCEPEWASEHCVDLSPDCPTRNATNGSTLIDIIRNANTTENLTFKYSADEYFHKIALAVSVGGIEETGTVQIRLWLSLTVAWLCVFLVLIKGIKSFGRTVYFTTLFPYLVLFILLVRGAMCDGALEGITFFIKPNWTMLAEPHVWSAALIQGFFSLSVCSGGIITLASYNRFRNNCYRDALIVGIGNALTSLFAGFVVFSILGMMAKNLRKSVDAVVTQGPGLAFIAYPQAVTLLPAAPVWSCLFFLMLITLALSSMFPTVENITTALIDQFPKQLRPYKFWVTLSTCLLCYLVGVAMCTNSGIYTLLLMDSYGMGWAVVLVGIFEIIVLSWRYGAVRVYRDVECMIGFKPSLYWAVMWKFVAPVLLVFTLIFTWVKFKPLTYGEGADKVEYPGWANGLGWFLSFVPVAMIPLYALYRVVLYYRTRTKDVTLWYILRDLSDPVPTWGPALPQNRTEDEDLHPDEDDVFAMNDMA